MTKMNKENKLKVLDKKSKEKIKWKRDRLARRVQRLTLGYTTDAMPQPHNRQIGLI